VQTIYHQAAIPSVPRSVDDPVTTTDVNCVGTATVLDAARDTGMETVVVASSSSVYGSETGVSKVETMAPQPESPYAHSKYHTDQLAMQFSELYEINTVALRYFNIFGPRQNPTGEYAAGIPNFAVSMLKGKRPIVFGDGDQSRDFTYVDNAVHANILAAESRISGETFNIGTNNQVTINELVHILNRALGTDINPIYARHRRSDVRHSYANISMSENQLGYKPVCGVEGGIDRTIEY
jgi:nucleoside-diphosphate-sugar epimerase